MKHIFEGERIEKSAILDMSGSGDVRKKEGENSIPAVTKMIENYIISV